MDDLLLQMLRWGQQGFGCSQILLMLGLDQKGESNPGLVRAMAGLAYGCGAGRATCGALTGGACLLAFLATDGSDARHPVEQLPMLLQELSDWFGVQVGQAHGGIRCEEITGAAGPAACRQICGGIVADTYAKVMEILSAGGLTP